MQLQTGQKISIKQTGYNDNINIHIDYGNNDLDLIIFSLNKEKKIKDDRYTVLFSNTSSPDQAIRLEKGNLTSSFHIDLTRLPDHVDRMMLVASHDDLPISQTGPLAVTIGNASYNPLSSLGAEKAVMLVEIYRHNSEWKISAIGQGFSQGLARLIEHLGGEVSANQNEKRLENTKPISLQKISLEKNKSVSLEKTGSSFEDIVLNLNWEKSRKGLFGNVPIDLDLGCLFEFQDGNKGIVQALGNSFGSYHHFPYMELDGDDRTGQVQSGETIRINGKYFNQIKRLAIFAMIYEGARKWSNTDAEITIRTPGQPEVSVRLSEENSHLPVYGMAIIENINGKMKVTNHSQFYKDQKDYADQMRIYLNWVPGRK